ncbi:hypothetical protein DL770_001707 [Monosporascus sp. CRB-9-2]|nr:hypothetical protein DL770_001707 [Monosporascus sp. CRB-9-2]
MASSPLNMEYLAINENLIVRLCPDASKGLGLFAARKLAKGLRIWTETCVFMDESRGQMSASIGDSITDISPGAQTLITRLFAGIQDAVPFMTPGPEKDRAAVHQNRLQGIIRYNAIEAAGTGCVLAVLCSLFNHSCNPAAWIYFNEALGAVTVHVLRDVEQGEEITLSYIQENIYLQTNERNSRLTN